MSQNIHVRADGSWEFTYGNDGDSRLRDPEKNAVPNYRVYNPITGTFDYQTLYRVYCRNCGVDGGLSARTAVYVVYLCDDCFPKNQDSNFIPMPSDEEVRWRQGLPPEGEEDKGKIVIAPK